MKTTKLSLLIVTFYGAGLFACASETTTESDPVAEDRRIQEENDQQLSTALQGTPDQEQLAFKAELETRLGPMASALAGLDPATLTEEVLLSDPKLSSAFLLALEFLADRDGTVTPKSDGLNLQGLDLQGNGACLPQTKAALAQAISGLNTQVNKVVVGAQALAFSGAVHGVFAVLWLARETNRLMNQVGQVFDGYKSEIDSLALPVGYGKSYNACAACVAAPVDPIDGGVPSDGGVPDAAPTDAGSDGDAKVDSAEGRRHRCTPGYRRGCR